MERKSITLAAVAFSVFAAVSGQGALIITGVVDGPRTGGLPKAIQLYATTPIADLSIYNVETPNNGGAALGSEFALSGSATAGQFIWIASESPGFTAYFGFAPTFVNGVANINGDDNVILYQSATTIDQFGVNGEDGTGQLWEYTDGYAYRVNGTGASPTYTPADWTFSGIDYLDSQGTSGTNGADGKTVPVSAYSPVPEPSAAVLSGLGLLALLLRRR